MADKFTADDRVVPKRRADLACRVIRKIEGSGFYECELLSPAPGPRNRTFAESDLEFADAASTAGTQTGADVAAAPVDHPC